MPEEERIKFNWKEIEPGSGWQKVTLRFDKPKTGSYMKDGEKFLYALLGVEVNGQDAGWFISDEVKELLAKLKVKKDSVLMIKTEFYRRYGKENKPINDVYGVLEFQGKEYPFGKEDNGNGKKQPEPKPKQPVREESNEPDKLAILTELYKDSLFEVLFILKNLYSDPEKAPSEQFGGSEVVRMVNTLFMAKAKQI